MARPLIANNNLPQILEHAEGPSPRRECTYCNKCLINDLENPLGCYEVSRFDGDTFEEKWENVIKDVMSVYSSPTFSR
jgi:2,4-dienoyl-CoA reductase (NADPH2)